MNSKPKHPDLPDQPRKPSLSARLSGVWARLRRLPRTVGLVAGAVLLAAVGVASTAVAAGGTTTAGVGPGAPQPEPRARRAIRTVCVTCVWAGVDNACEQENAEARKMLENAAESHTSGARFVSPL